MDDVRNLYEKILIFKKLRRSKAKWEGFISTHYYCISFICLCVRISESACHHLVISGPDLHPEHWRCWAPHSLPGDIGSQQQPWPHLSPARSGHSIKHIVRAITSLICLHFLKSRHKKKVTYPWLKTFLSWRIHVVHWRNVPQI